MDFPWLERAKPTAASETEDRRHAAACEELASRAGLMFRMGVSKADATKRLCERLAWEFEGPTKGANRRPTTLSDDAIGKIVDDTYARRPGW
jgi:hypothetical protein